MFPSWTNVSSGFEWNGETKSLLQAASVDTNKRKPELASKRKFYQWEYKWWKTNKQTNVETKTTQTNVINITKQTDKCNKQNIINKQYQEGASEKRMRT